jgi:CheY-like chemotaxis protein
MLLVDDRANRDSVASVIRGLGHEVSLVVSARDALEQTRARSFDVVLADVQLADGSGLELLLSTSQELPMSGGHHAERLRGSR